MGASQRRLLAAAASLAIATSTLGFIAPAAIAAPTTVTNEQVTEPTTPPTATPAATATGLASPQPTQTKAPAPTEALAEQPTAAPTKTQEPSAPSAPTSTAATTQPKLQTEATAGGGVATTTGQTLLAELPLTRNVAPTYSRDYFTHWIDADGNGCDTRAEVLKAESQVPVTYSSGCTVATGRWTSPYDGATWTNASDVDIDHVVPLAEAWRSIAWSWTTEQRTAFANDLGYANSLIAVTDSVNQSKGDQDPASWMPAQNQCQYAINWVSVKWRWNIGVDPDERVTLESYLNGTQCGSTPVPSPGKMITNPSQQKYALYKIVYDSTIYEMVPDSGGTEIPRQLSFEKWRDVYNFQTPTPASTDFVKYPWSPTVYAVTFWPGGENYWMWTRLSYQQWQTAGYPTPRNAGWINGSYYYKWGTSSELFVEGEDGVNHKLTGAEWAASGYRSYVDRGSEGFMKLTWAPEFARMSNLSSGAGRPMGYTEWQEEAFPTPQAVQRITGDKFYRDCASSTIWYAGPGMNRPVSLQEWQGAGSPSPTVTGTCTSPTPTQPAKPADKDCSDFRTQAEAQAWFNTYYPYYGDFAMLDSDGDRIACEYLP